MINNCFHDKLDPSRDTNNVLCTEVIPEDLRFTLPTTYIIFFLKSFYFSSTDTLGTDILVSKRKKSNTELNR